MKYFWLNQKDSDSSPYKDEEGQVYHYREYTPGYKQLSTGDRFVYYRPGKHVLFGTGTIGDVEQREWGMGDGTETHIEYYAHIENYRPFDPELNVREIKNQISFLQDRNGLSGVPQNSIRRLDKDDFLTIIEAAGVELFDV
ncbi:EVE domain-containing protein [Haloarchaeobius sp. HME9146]|uniref:EVE domain-containing protein n=1 Tax=Haloarchaeobius sp. HME9146 TaxID=2978732 RepID=UPI0021C12457|nr:EVE domain-containing protein [Haloarchaeobius sp. HME9146]MCT9095166.1 EVE domain-containing protein [Haloarchaeobius sp. HME9146]